MENIINIDFFKRDVLEVAPELLGTRLCRRMPGGGIIKAKITQTEAYKGREDKACHAFRGRTPRNEVMFHEGGICYVYLIYGIHWMMNIVTGEKDDPQAVLIRECEGLRGPGILTKALGIDRTFNGMALDVNNPIWIEGGNKKNNFSTAPRVGIDYAGEYWKNIEWRFIYDEEK